MNDSISDLNAELKKAEISAVRAKEQLTLSETEKCRLEQKYMDLDLRRKTESRNKIDWAELIKVIGAAVLGLGGLAAAYHQHEIAEVKASLAEEKERNAEKALADKSIEIEKAIKDLESVLVLKDRAIEEQKIAEKNKQEIESTLEGYQSELSRLSSRIKAKAPNLATSELVYLQFQGNTTRGQINDLRDVINSNGFNSPGAERLKGDYENKVVYFSESDASAAQSLAELTEKYFSEKDCPLSIQLISRIVDESSATPIEMWLSHSCN